MAWLQLRVASAHPEFVEEVLLAHGAAAVSFVDAADEPVLEPAPGATPLWSRTLTLGLFAEHTELAPIRAALRELVPDGDSVQVASELVEDQDWVRVWLKDCPPLKFGERFWVVPREKRAEVTDADAIVLELDPGLAFGTGTHPTTALCLEWLARAELAGAQVLDYGCGSGILAIAALKLGAAGAVATDIDPQAITASQSNARDNGVAERLRALPAERFVPFPADVVLANILANPLVALAPRLASSIAPGGRLILAGLLDRQAEEVRAAYAPWFDFEPDVTREGWTRITARCRLPALISELAVSPTLLTAGQPQRAHFPALKARGIEAVINLATSASPNHLADEAQLCADNGLAYHALPVPWEQPSAEHLERFFALLRELEGRKVLVHCALNLRVSSFVFLHRVLNLGDDVDAAAADLHRIWQPEPTWSRFIEAQLARRRSA